MFRRFLVFLLIGLALVGPAAAHKLKVFAAVEGSQITGYGFFIGGGRAQETSWVAKTADGEVIAKGTTDVDGSFTLTPTQPVVSDITITLDTHEGHIASVTIAATRFGVIADPEPATAVAANTNPASNPPGTTVETIASQPDTAALVEAAVQRQVAPLLERIERMDDRLRYADILSGIFLIIGLAGIGLWARGLRK